MSQASRVIFLDDDRDLREIFSDLMSGLGVSITAVGSVPELEVAMTDPADKFDLAILDINLGHDEQSGIDAYRWLKAHHFAGRTVFLTGHARSHPLVSEAQRLGDASVFDKPITVADLREIMDPDSSKPS